MSESSSPSPWIVQTTDATFEQDVVERSKQVPVVIDFWATWCQPCQLLGPLLEKLAVEYDGKFVLVKADTEQTPAAAGQFSVQSIPAVYGMRDAEVLDFFVGLLPEDQLRQWIDRLLPTETQLLVKAGSELLSDDPVAAEKKFREALELSADDAPAKIALAEALLAQGHVDQSVEIISQLEERGFLEPEAERVKSAAEVKQLGSQAGGVDVCRQAVQANPDDFSAQLKLAEALAAEEQFEEALQIGLKLVQQDRHNTGEVARQVMVDIFRLLPDDSEMLHEFRRQLSTSLY